MHFAVDLGPLSRRRPTGGGHERVEQTACAVSISRDDCGARFLLPRSDARDDQAPEALPHPPAGAAGALSGRR